ncbi:MAG: M48 family metalloprotease [Azoarcus sp.]|jgi:predicted Zn-dependent protease|nr:M48 family metalloprotease [Azoarcus sp.]
MKSRLLTFLLCLALACPVPGIAPVRAAGLPDLGEVAADELSPLEERRIGEEIMREFRRDPAWLDDPLVEEYIDRLGRRLAAASTDPSRVSGFFVIKDATLNAFAMPGGYIVVHTGLILAAESESELAGVLGHEVTHVTQRHIAQLVGKQSQSTMIMLASLLVAMLAARSNSQLSEAAVMAGQAGALQSQLGYSRDFEREADRGGLQTLEAAGFDVRGMAGFFGRLQRAGRLYENNAPAYLRTHPLTTERIADMENRVAGMRYRQVPDSDDFRYTRTRLRVQALPAAEALRAFTEWVDASPEDVSMRYGLALAQLRMGRLDEAGKGLDELRRRGANSPFIEMLAGELAMARHETGQAIKILEAARRTFPASMSIAYALADARINAGASASAVVELRRMLNGRNNDIRLWALLARAQTALGRRTAQHRAQAEVHALQGAYPAALEQLELARKAGDSDFYELSAVDARLREIRERVRETRRAGGNNGSGREEWNLTEKSTRAD